MWKLEELPKGMYCIKCRGIFKTTELNNERLKDEKSICNKCNNTKGNDIFNNLMDILK